VSKKRAIGHSIELEWENGQFVFAVYEWRGDSDPDARGRRLRRRLESFSSFELARQRYPDAMRTAPGEWRGIHDETSQRP